ncbi:hypothetical protein [Porphyrobacter sp. YT40]|uniref:hypothetical protein n=1 Tax=Porphyrobacter sp. YT40 TaxID=2547601 RepID=UPI0011433630|nr:hypothetical protein [Porphyrobacter sp. YT40]QDH35038.1 hypothetical protein E2E27_12320 [Porphyrobacter sp. YT40]
MALGAGLASLSFVVGLQMTRSANDSSFVLSTRIGGESQSKLIGVAGACAGRFRAETTSHTFEISYSISDLSTDDIACLIEKSGPIRRDVFIRRQA